MNISANFYGRPQLQKHRLAQQHFPSLITKVGGILYANIDRGAGSFIPCRQEIVDYAVDPRRFGRRHFALVQHVPGIWVVGELLVWCRPVGGPVCGVGESGVSSRLGGASRILRYRSMARLGMGKGGPEMRPLILCPPLSSQT